MSLQEYKKKRDFDKTPEPAGKVKKKQEERLLFVVQKHEAKALHWDFRLEIDGMLKSWAVPKGPSPNLDDKRLAVPTEDHPLEYANFEGVIPEGHYGAGRVMIWDKGTFESLKDYETIGSSYREGRIEVKLKGKKMNGKYALIRIKPRNKSTKEPWLLLKMKGDEWENKKYPKEHQ